MSQTHDRTCPRCGAVFTCDHSAGRDPCWCATRFPNVLPVPSTAEGCLCAKCLADRIEPAARGIEASS